MGKLVVEPVCENPVTQKDTLQEGVCTNLHQTFQPVVGQHVTVIGAYVTDVEHGWNEIHPVTSIQVTPSLSQHLFQKLAITSKIRSLPKSILQLGFLLFISSLCFGLSGTYKMVRTRVVIRDERLVGELKNTGLYNVLGWGPFGDQACSSGLVNQSTRRSTRISSVW